MENAFNENLRRIRKERNITQEQLADAVGVSAQAVSKWEMKGYPDTQLLPAIADFLSVSIDELFGREKSEDISIYDSIITHIRELPSEEEKMSLAFDMCRAITIAFAGVAKYYAIDEQTLKATDCEYHSQITWNSGILQSRLNENLQYFLLMPDPQKGYDDVLAYHENAVKLFSFLSDPDALRALYFLAGRESSMFFTAKALSHELRIKAEKANEIIAGMLELKFIWAADLNGGCSNEKIYQYIASCNLVSFLTFARTLICRPASFHYQCNSRNKPYLKNDTYNLENKPMNDLEKG